MANKNKTRSSRKEKPARPKNTQTAEWPITLTQLDELSRISEGLNHLTRILAATVTDTQSDLGCAYAFLSPINAGLRQLEGEITAAWTAKVKGGAA